MIRDIKSKKWFIFVVSLFFLIVVVLIFIFLPRPNGVQKYIEGQIIEIDESKIVITVTKKCNSSFSKGDTVVLNLPTVSTAGIPEGTAENDIIKVQYNAFSVTTNNSCHYIDIVFSIYLK